MTLTLRSVPKNATIIQGYPGFGLVGTIATEYLLEHLKCEPIGRILLEEQPALIAIHEGRVVEPIGIFYSKKHNLVVVHAINSTSGAEWKIAELVVELAKKVNARELVCIEGVGSPEKNGEEEEQTYRTFYYANKAQNAKKLQTLKIEQLREGIIMGVTSALLLDAGGSFPITCLFAETKTHLPDSKAAANALTTLSNYLGLKLNIKPLLDSAEHFEQKLHSLLEKSKGAVGKQKKDLTYLG